MIAVSVTLFFGAAISLLAYDRGYPHGQTQQDQQLAQQLPQTAKSPQSTTQTMEVSTADISAGLKKYIDGYTKKSPDRKFHVRYRGKDLALDLIDVHDDRLSSLGSGKYPACVDMKATGGMIYDIDFFMALRPGKLNITETSVHKINGKPLYNWKEEKGVWKRVRVS
jgi:hypothetical protein